MIAKVKLFAEEPKVMGDEGRRIAEKEFHTNVVNKFISLTLTGECEMGEECCTTAPSTKKVAGGIRVLE